MFFCRYVFLKDVFGKRSWDGLIEGRKTGRRQYTGGPFSFGFLFRVVRPGWCGEGGDTKEPYAMILMVFFFR